MFVYVDNLYLQMADVLGWGHDGDTRGFGGPGGGPGGDPLA
jgi:hypothetical protein